ncbi:hypothetical protein Q8A67_018903 [Cirrhinus molitorella]|uniref:FISNA domain-containing protein n=1 Tax=Cirrhinus molitorella TaxID=172907 RepID=A0AA88PDS3_9TELE|nr:hypothetical protein Q8A67_018903 [Cirrhinus molitorella]
MSAKTNAKNINRQRAYLIGYEKRGPLPCPDSSLLFTESSSVTETGQRSEAVSQVQKTKDEDFSPGCSSVKQERSDSPENSSVSMKSDWSMDPPLQMKPGDRSQSHSLARQKSSDSPEPSCVSMKSDWSMDPPLQMKFGDRSQSHSLAQQKSSDSPEPSCVSMKSDWSMDPPLQMKFGDRSQSHRQNLRPRPVVTEPACKKMEHDKSVNQPQVFNKSMCPGVSQEFKVFNTFKTKLMKKFQCLYEGIAKQGNPTLLNEIYTELYITESESGEISNEHELNYTIDSQYSDISPVSSGSANGSSHGQIQGLYGVEEMSEGEDVKAQVVQICRSIVPENEEVCQQHIDVSHRVGRKNAEKARPVIISTKIKGSRGDQTKPV